MPVRLLTRAGGGVGVKRRSGRGGNLHEHGEVNRRPFHGVADGDAIEAEAGAAVARQLCGVACGSRKVGVAQVRVDDVWVGRGRATHCPDVGVARAVGQCRGRGVGIPRQRTG